MARAGGSWQASESGPRTYALLFCGFDFWQAPRDWAGVEVMADKEKSEL